MKVYIAGPMRGVALYNFPAFDEAEERLRDEGHDPINPARLDREAGFAPDNLDASTDWTKSPEGFNMEAAISRDLEAIRQADALYLLDGWQKSKGATAEHAMAVWLGKQIIFQTPPEATETIVTDATTGGQKATKLARFDLIPTEPLWELAEHYGKGAQKYADDNWRRGYSWKLTFAALMRHAMQFWGGEDIDPETGSKHVTAIAWHAFTLSWFMEHRRNKDDRPSRLAVGGTA